MLPASIHNPQTPRDLGADRTIGPVRPRSDGPTPVRPFWPPPPWSDHPTLVGPYNLGRTVGLSDLGLTVRPCSDFLALVRLSDLGPMVRPQSDRPTSVRLSDLGPTVRPWSNSPTVRPPSDRPTSVWPSDLSPTVRPQSNSPTSVQQSDLSPTVRPRSNSPTLVPWSVLSPTIQPQSNFLASVCSNLFQWSDCPTMVSESYLSRMVHLTIDRIEKVEWLISFNVYSYKFMYIQKDKKNVKKQMNLRVRRSNIRILGRDWSRNMTRNWGKNTKGIDKCLRKI